MKIVFVTDHFSTPDEPGILRTWQIVKHLAGEGDEVVVIAPAQHYLFAGGPQVNAEFSTPDRVRLVRMRTSRLHRGSALSRLRWYAEQCVLSAILTWQAGRVDVVIAGLTPSMLGIGAFWAARLRRVPFVIDERDLSLDAAEQADLLPRPMIRAARCVERFLYSRAAKAITVTPGLHQSLIERGVPREKLALAPNGYDDLPVKSSKDNLHDLRDRLGWADCFVLLYAGGLGPMYDLNVVLDALADLDRERFLFVIMGVGEYKEQYRDRVEREKLPVRFAEPVPKSDVATFCRAADVCVVPLRDIPRSQLVLSNKLFDYLGAGRPVVVTGEGDMADLVRSARAGFVIPPGDGTAFADALRALASSPGLANQMGDAGREYVQRSWTRAASVRNFRSALLEACQTKSGPATEKVTNEHDRIRSVYQYYDATNSERRKRDGSNPGVRRNADGRWQVLRQALNRAELGDGAMVLDVGCGSGGDLRRIASGFGSLNPSMFGIDLLPERITRARELLSGATLSVGGAEHLAYEDGQFDVVIAATVFSSILDDDVASAVASEMRRVLASDGVILCYDVRYNNVLNPHTRPIRKRQIRQLFPKADIRLTTVTLLPPLARSLGVLSKLTYQPMHSIPLLRSHYLAEIRPANPYLPSADNEHSSTLRSERANADES